MRCCCFGYSTGKCKRGQRPRSEVARAPRIGSRLGFASASQLLHVGRPQQLKPTAIATMSQFRAKTLDIGCFAKIRNIRDHTKRKVYEANEPER
jgi:hypothetical protein